MRKFLPLLLLLFQFPAYAQDGVLDLSFGTSGVAKTNLNPPKGATTNTPTDLSKIVVQKDGKIIQVGYKGSSTGDDFIVIRYNANGTPDASFGTQGGWTVTDINGSSGNDRAHSVAVQDDGKIIVVGETTVGAKIIFAVVRYNPDGKTLDNTFGAGGVVLDLNSNPSGAYTVAVQPDGKILVGGYGKEGATNDFVLARYNSDGSFDNTFDTDGKVFTDFASGNDAATDIHLLTDGTNRILVGGYAASAGSTYFALAIYNSDGSLNSAFNGGKVLGTFTGSGRSVDIDDNGKIYFTGLSNSTGNYDFTTVSYNQDGTLNSTFGAAGIVKTNLGSSTDASRSVKVQCDGKIVVGGEFNDPVTGRYSYVVVRYGPDGTLDNTFNGNGKSIVNTGGSSNDYDYGFSGLAFQGDKILMGGVSFPPPVSILGRIYFNPTIIRLQNSTAPTGNISPASATICTGGSQLLTTSGGTSYQWSLNGTTIGGATSATYNATAAGTYSVVITNGTCSGPASNTSTITIASAPTGNISPASATICTGGSQLLTTSGGTSYQWSLDGTIIGGATSATYNATAAGTYSVVITNGTCSGPASNTSTITIAPAPTGNISPASATICTGGSQLLTTSGGTSYQWSLDGTTIGGATSATYNATAAGNYSVMITNGTCSGPASNTSTITIASAPTGNISPASATICTGGSQLLTTSGGASYQWSLDGTTIGGATSATYNATAAGTYSVVITNGTCSGPASNTSTITIAPAPTGNISPASATICSGGSQLLTTSGGTSYQWSLNGTIIGGATSATYNATAAGNYSVMITNGTCSGPASNTSTITIAPAPTGNISPGSATICTGGSQLLTTSGGTSYQWSLNGSAIIGATLSTYNATTAGTYSVVITNGTCSGPASNTSTITIASAPTGNISPASATICSGGSQLLTTSGGTSYQWSLNGTTIGGATSATYNATAAGNYSVMITNGTCSGPASNTSTITIASAPTGNISPASATICTGGSQLLTTSGGTSYQWSLNGTAIGGATSETYNTTAGGTYSVVITNGTCSGPASNTSTITIAPAPTGNISPASATICSGGSQLLTTSGGTSYQWSLNGTTIGGATSATYNATAAGNYSVMITNGTCSGPASNTSTITIASAPTGNISPASATICTGGSQLLTTSGGTSYQWSLNGTTIGGATSATYNATAAGTYSVVITNGTCSGPASNTSTITIASAPTGNISPASATICTGGSQLLTTSGGTSYQWSLNGTLIGGATSSTYNATAAGTYSVVITNGTCSGPASNISTITIASAPTGNISPAIATICTGGSQLLTTSGGTSYQWSLDGTAIGGATGDTYNATAAGTYSVVITNGTCSGPASNISTITIASAPTGSITPASTTICPGGSQLLTTSGGTSYQWSLDGTAIGGATSATYNATAAGTYSVVITNGTCSGPASNTASINVGATPSVSITALGPTEFCTGKSVSLEGNADGNYQWYKDDVLIPGAVQKTYIATNAGTYKTVVTNTTNCTSTSNEITVTTMPLPSGVVTAASDVICAGSNIVLNVSGGTAYQWYLNGFPVPGATASAYSATLPGVYGADITNEKGCQAASSNTLILKIIEKPSADFSFDLSCQNQPTHFTNKSIFGNSGPIKWHWNFGDLSSSDSFSPSHIFSAGGNYTVTLGAEPEGCSQLTDSIKKIVNITASIQGLRYTTVRVVKNVAFPLSARNIGQQYQWQPPSDLNDPFSRTPYVTTVKERQYTIRIGLENGCDLVDTLLVQVYDKTEVFVPKAFTPNNNNENDLLRPIVVNIPNLRFFRIYNRWGQLVFETQKIGEGWNGIFKGVKQPTETYTWVFEGTDIKGNIIKSSGQTILIR